jgi:hypothetical protein
MVVLHSVLSFADAHYVEGRRRISLFEQTVHGFMDVLPPVAIGLFAVVRWPELNSATPLARHPRSRPGAASWILLGSFLILAGAPVLEEVGADPAHAWAGRRWGCLRPAWRS